MIQPSDAAPPVSPEDSSSSGTVLTMDVPPTSATSRRSDRRAPVPPEKRAQIMKALAEKDHPSFREMERLYGVSSKTIHGWSKEKKAALAPIDDGSTTSVAQGTEDEYRRRTKRALPVRERVRILREIAQGVPFKVECSKEHENEHGQKVKCGNVLDFKLPVASASERLKAIQRADELEGVVTAVQRREAEAGGNTVQPLFALPTSHCPGCSCPPGAARAVGIMAMVAPVRAPATTTGGGLPPDGDVPVIRRS